MRVYQENDRRGLEPILALRELDGMVELNVVDEDGDVVAYLIEFYDDRAVRIEGAREELQSDGYRTDFAQWTQSGAIMLSDE